MDAGVGMGVGTGVDGVDGDMQSMESLECMEPGPASTPAPAATSACIRFWGFSTVFFCFPVSTRSWPPIPWRCLSFEGFPLCRGSLEEPPRFSCGGPIATLFHCCGLPGRVLDGRSLLYRPFSAAQVAVKSLSLLPPDRWHGG